MDNRIGVIGLLTAFLALGGVIILNPSEFSNAYICPATKMVGVFPGGVSSTSLTAYIQKGNATGSMKCDSKWTPLLTYAKANNIDPLLLVAQSQVYGPVTTDTYIVMPKRYLCKTEGGCVELK